MKFVLIEQDEDYSGFIHHIDTEDIEKFLIDFEGNVNGNSVVLTEQDFYNMCKNGVGC